MLGALEVRRAERVDDDPDAVASSSWSPSWAPRSKPSAYSKPGAAAALDRDAQHLGVAGRLLGLELLDLRRRALGERR